MDCALHTISTSFDSYHQIQRPEAFLSSRASGNTCLGWLKVIFFFDSDDGDSPLGSTSKKICYTVMEMSNYFVEIVCIELHGRTLGQNFPFSLYPALIVLDLCDVNRIFKRAPISKRHFFPFAFDFTSPINRAFILYLYIYSFILGQGSPL